MGLEEKSSIFKAGGWGGGVGVERKSKQFFKHHSETLL